MTSHLISTSPPKFYLNRGIPWILLIIGIVLCLFHTLNSLPEHEIVYNQETILDTETDPINLVNLKIPKIIHQSWKNRDIPEQFLNWSQTWVQFNPSFEYKLWSDQDNRELIMEHYPWFLSTYDAFPQPIHKADAARVFYLHKYGGVYTDLDIENVRPLDSLLAGHELVLARMGQDTRFLHSLPNAWMASRPGHSFWMWCAKEMMSKEYWNKGVEYIAGPIMLHRAFEAFQQSGNTTRESIHVADSDAIYPFNWKTDKKNKYPCSARSETFNTERCKRNLGIANNNKTFAITYWSHSWGDASL